jgi:hypothetical protein
MTDVSIHLRRRRAGRCCCRGRHAQAAAWPCPPCLPTRPECAACHIAYPPGCCPPESVAAADGQPAQALRHRCLARPGHAEDRRLVPGRQRRHVQEGGTRSVAAARGPHHRAAWFVASTTRWTPRCGSAPWAARPTAPPATPTPRRAASASARSAFPSEPAMIDTPFPRPAGPAAPPRVLVWDAPVRVFHWLTGCASPAPGSPPRASAGGCCT